MIPNIGDLGTVAVEVVTQLFTEETGRAVWGVTEPKVQTLWTGNLQLSATGTFVFEPPYLSLPTKFWSQYCMC